MTIKLSTEELAAELDRRQQDQEAEAAHQAETLREAQQEWSKALLRVFKAKESQLEEEGAASMKAAEESIREGDLAGAYFKYTGYHASRMARYNLRGAAQSSINRVPGYDGPNINDLRTIDSDFPDWLNNQVHRLAERDGSARFEEILGADIPTNYEDAKAWLESNRGE